MPVAMVLVIFCGQASTAAHREEQPPPPKGASRHRTGPCATYDLSVLHNYNFYAFYSHVNSCCNYQTPLILKLPQTTAPSLIQLLQEALFIKICVIAGLVTLVMHNANAHLSQTHSLLLPSECTTHPAAPKR